MSNVESRPGFFKRLWNGIKRFFCAIGRKLRDVYRELRKVTWPNFPTVVKQTGVVVSVVIFFLLVVFAMDLGLSQLYRILIDRISG